MTIHIFGGGTLTHVRSHASLCAPARGGTARALEALCKPYGMPIKLHLTGMADHTSLMETNDDVELRLREVLADPAATYIIFNVALCDIEGQIGDIASGKYAERIQTRDIPDDGLLMKLRATKKLLGLVRELRPDIISVGFKTTTGETPEVQLARANRMAAEHGINWVLANDTATRNNIVLPGTGWATLGHASYNGTDRAAALATLVRNLFPDPFHG